MDNIQALYHQYYEKAMTWYGGLTVIEQMGVLFVLFVIGFGIIAYFLVKRAVGN